MFEPFALQFLRSTISVYFDSTTPELSTCDRDLYFSSITQSCLTLCDSMDCSTPGFPVHHPTPRACSNSCPLSQLCHLTISSSVVPFSFCHQFFPASEYVPIGQFFTSGGQSIGVSASASVPPMTIQDWFPLGRTGWISFQSKDS